MHAHTSYTRTYARTHACMHARTRTHTHILQSGSAQMACVAQLGVSCQFSTLNEEEEDDDLELWAWVLIGIGCAVVGTVLSLLLIVGLNCL